ncbi:MULTISPECIES: uroporphyrinogen-III synthase [unclassified Arenibacter]|uniref:uroporphyrinogen-III synthase n=1 Tax=unclassified Arenibacter TaxID=2615047 RepID=UPI000E343834|nr:MULTISPECIES: uroporphyrinogen-III synthase [unclassified Arenibacter]MCM4162060.1 uroporphyrinogen-III synthase [Arenibacter sp. A80]RFT58329.1 uroporphyrinogen-III synthase [Arenibacter sp. P308M17]
MTILSTKILTSSQKSMLAQADIQLEDYDAIKINYLRVQIDPNFKNIIFTSQNTVKAFLKIMGPKNLKNNTYAGFCVGEKTKSALENNGIKVLEMNHYGAELAKILATKYQNESFLFLCGDKRRNEIPTFLTKHNVEFKEQIIYQNNPNPITFITHFDGILFFSPSGIASFTTKNKMRNSVAFCIGTTTASEAQKHTKKIIIAEKPTVESVLEKAVEYSESNKI